MGMRHMPTIEIDALLLETTYGTPAEITAAAVSANAERDLLVRLIIRAYLGSMTGDIARDERVVAQMGGVGDIWANILAVRPPSAFL